MAAVQVVVAEAIAPAVVAVQAVAAVAVVLVAAAVTAVKPQRSSINTAV